MLSVGKVKFFFIMNLKSLFYHEPKIVKVKYIQDWGPAFPPPPFNGRAIKFFLQLPLRRDSFKDIRNKIKLTISLVDLVEGEDPVGILVLHHLQLGVEEGWELNVVLISNPYSAPDYSKVILCVPRSSDPFYAVTYSNKMGKYFLDI